MTSADGFTVFAGTQVALLDEGVRRRSERRSREGGRGEAGRVWQ